MIIVAMLLVIDALANGRTSSESAVGVTYYTEKSIAELQKCLTDKLSARGEVTAIIMQDGTTLMLREGDNAPMLIDLEPPSVKVTTRFAYGTRTIIRRCI